MDTAVSKKGQINSSGEDLKNEFSYEKTIDALIKRIEQL
jgi:hypothetical protein